MISRVFLVGFMGSGKSTLGKLIAEELGFSFVDLDETIERTHHSTITQIFAQYGEEGFRTIEKNALHDLVQVDQVVVASGGGTPCFYDNMDWMKHHGLVVFLNPDAETLMLRLEKEQDHRPLIRHMDQVTLKDFIIQKLKERIPYYACAELEVMDIEDNNQSAKWISRQVQLVDRARQLRQ